MPERISCIVPFCRRTASAERFPGSVVEIICGKHWRLVSSATKAERRKWRALERKACQRGRHMPRLFSRVDALWARCKAEAIERPAGIS